MKRYEPASPMRIISRDTAFFGQGGRGMRLFPKHRRDEGKWVTNIPLLYRILNGIISSDILLGRVLSIYLYSIAYSIANSVGYFIHTALGDVLTKLTKADFSNNFFYFLQQESLCVGHKQ